MKTIQKIIQAGFATCALASASMPALSWTVWPNVDFEWYADIGRRAPDGLMASGLDVTAYPATVGKFPPPREGYIWAPGHYVRVPGDNVQVQLVGGRWIKDDYLEQVAKYAAPDATLVAVAPPQR
jgi:hypothetical protein